MQSWCGGSLPIYSIHAIYVIAAYKLWLANKSYKLTGCIEDFPQPARQTWNIISHNIVGSGCTTTNCVSYTMSCTTQTDGTIICVLRLKRTEEKKPLLRYFVVYLDVMVLALCTAATTTTIQFKNNRVAVVNIIILYTLRAIKLISKIYI